ncbi:conserved hypothetical protein [Trichinella spiralis]|uniref:hypothetical protein n=1 Tax=Trichinella spiralis TaxID=6334 RepID=UPI0001EFB844|nr:conserved hypothetical protein [Trichinella spiralis]
MTTGLNGDLRASVVRHLATEMNESYRISKNLALYHYVRMIIQFLLFCFYLFHWRKARVRTDSGGMIGAATFLNWLIFAFTSPLLEMPQTVARLYRRALRLLSGRDACAAAASLDKLSRTLYNTAVSKLINQSNSRKQQMNLVGRISIAWSLYIFINNRHFLNTHKHTHTHTHTHTYTPRHTNAHVRTRTLYHFYTYIHNLVSLLIVHCILYYCNGNNVLLKLYNKITCGIHVDESINRNTVYPIRGTVFGWLTPHQLRGSFGGGGGDH